MFLDPDPKRRQPSMSSSTFFLPKTSGTSSQELRDAHSRLKPLHRRSKSRQNEQQPAQPAQPAKQPTVRLVNPSPPQTTQTQATTTDDTSGIIVAAEADDGKENWEQPGSDALPRLPLFSVEQEASVPYPRISAASRHSSVSEPSWTTNEAQDIDGPPSITLLSDTSGSAHELPKPTIWHRRSTSSGNYSQSSTLHDSEIAFSKKSLKSERLSSLSQLSTLRGTPSPYEHENKERAESEGFSQVGPAEALHTLEEVSPERPQRLSTIRAVSPSETSSPSKTQSETQSSEPSPTRPRTFSGTSNLEQPPYIPPRTSSRRNHSTGSIPSSPIIFTAAENTVSPSPAAYQRSESRAISEGPTWQPSSPNFIAYTPDSAHPISRDPLRNATSDESINSRLQFASATHSETGRSLGTTSSWGSLRSIDTLPPLHVPKKRLRHKAGSESLISLASSSRSGINMDDEDIDTLPYPKRPFSTHLSTIASESETSRSRTASQHLSHFSLGSGVLTGDDSSSLPLSPKRHRRNDSAPANSMGTRGTSSEFEEDVGDMTLGIYREESAIPQPLFRSNVKPLAVEMPRKYDGSLPPMPPIPPNVESDEHVDTLSALQAPPLRQQRSGKSLRARSNSTPGHSRQQSQASYVDSERFSQGSSLFPTWAKHFYSGTAVLASKASFGSLSNTSRWPTRHRRNQSSWTERSITSRLGTDYENNVESSPTSSHFLPSIFRPRTRKRAGSHQRDSRSSKIRKSGRSRPSQDRPSQDSMAIRPIPPLPGTEHSPDVLPSGQPRWGVLKDSHSTPESQRRPLPRKYSKQRQWDHMEFPRPMTKDRLSDFGVHDPHLAPSKRSSQNRLSAWQAPSFVSGLDTLITSRCNRQILLFTLGFVCPFLWMLGAILPLPRKPTCASDLEKQTFEGSEEDVQIAMMKHEAGDAERRWREERTYLKTRWWRMLNRIMSVIGLLVIGAVIALVVVATT